MLDKFCLQVDITRLVDIRKRTRILIIIWPLTLRNVTIDLPENGWPALVFKSVIDYTAMALDVILGQKGGSLD